MSEGWGSAAANAAIDAAVAAYPWIKLHVGAPGSAGTSNPATETTRKQATFASASAGSAATSGTLTWSSVAGSEDFTNFTAWSASTAGTLGYSGTITANAVSSGDTFTIASGQLTVTLPLAS